MLSNLETTANICSLFVPFVVKCKTNNTLIHHLEDENGNDFTLYAIIHNISFNKEKLIRENDLTVKRCFNINASFSFSSYLTNNLKIEIEENYDSPSGLIRAMATVLSCIKDDSLNELNAALNIIKNKLNQYNNPLTYLVNKGDFETIVSHLSNDDIIEQKLSVDKLINIDNHVGLNGWANILYKTSDDKWYLIRDLFTKCVRNGNESLSVDKSCWPKKCDELEINSNLYKNKYEKVLKIKKIGFTKSNPKRKRQYSININNKSKKQKMKECDVYINGDNDTDITHAVNILKGIKNSNLSDIKDISDFNTINYIYKYIKELKVGNIIDRIKNIESLLKSIYESFDNIEK